MYNQPDPVQPAAPAYEPDAATVPVDVREDVVETVDPGDGTAASYHESHIHPAGYPVESHVVTPAERNLRRAQMKVWLVNIIYFILTVLEVILGLRFIFRLLGANNDNAFIIALYNLSHVFVGPFNNIFNDQSIGSHSVFELSTLVAMLIYALIAWGLASLVRISLAPAQAA